MMAQAYKSHKTSFIWLLGSSGVQGFELDELNYYIDYYNKCAASNYMDFWAWLRIFCGFNVYGFSCLWNDGNPLMSKVHSIKSSLKDGDINGL